jgi:glycosyltransferase involved in cell wall biosynthesis
MDVWNAVVVPRLSVLIPAHDAAATIVAALRSTLRDLPADAEVLVFDDGSGDGTGDRVVAVSDPRVKLIRSPRNVGVAAALNRLLDHADGELVARMDADDICLPGRFGRQLRALDQGADLVFSTFQLFGQGPRRPALPVTLGPEAGALSLLLFCPAHSTLLARRDSLVGVGGYRQTATEDYDLWLRTATAGARIVRLGRPGILLRQSPGQVTAQAGFRDRVRADPVIAASYLALAHRLWGVDEAPWLPELSMLRAGPLSDAARPVVSAFVHRFIASLATLRPLERWSLARRARQELGWRAG